MVEKQIRQRGVADPRVLEAMTTVPRERFVQPGTEAHAYDDGPQAIGYGQTISQPYIVAYMTEMLDVRPSDRVLEIGTGSGYQTAILSELARRVFTIEIVPELAGKAAALLRELGCTNVEIRVGDANQGWPDQAPFDRIVVTAAPAEIPGPLIEQLTPAGRLVVPIGVQGESQWMTIVDKTLDGLAQRRTIPVQFVPFTRG